MVDGGLDNHFPTTNRLKQSGICAKKGFHKFGSEQKRPGANRPPEFVPESPLQKGVFGSHIISKQL